MQSVHLSQMVLEEICGLESPTKVKAQLKAKAHQYL
jgi:hypothetical protein